MAEDHHGADRVGHGESSLGKAQADNPADEPEVLLTVPALTSAIADAIGIRFNDLPVTPDRVFAAIEKRRRAQGSSGNGHA